MQRAKDTFYVMLRDGVAAVNPQRTTAVRGVQRPAVLVEENELLSGVALVETFRLRWTEVSVDPSGTVPMAKLRCEIRYETAGTAAVGGMDRGRTLTAMDGELRTVLSGTTQSAAKMDFSGATPVAGGTRIFWGDPDFGTVSTVGDRLGRVATVEIWSLEGAGEP